MNKNPDPNAPADATAIPDPIALITPRRQITGMSAILLPFAADGSIEWNNFDAHVGRTLEAGLIPAVNMDTGYANLIDSATRAEVLRRTQEIAAGDEFIAGVFVGDQPQDTLNRDAYRAGADEIQRHGGTPIFFQSFGLTQGDDDAIAEGYRVITSGCDKFLAFELGTMFAPFGKIYSLHLYEQLMRMPHCAGAKHSSLRRDLEWQRIALRNRVRPDFMVLTGNDLAIDMVIYGSDYLLGLSTFSPAAFARRDQMWREGDAGFYELNDLLQYLGAFAFRDPVPAYKHSAAMFLHLQGWTITDRTHPASPVRPVADVEVLRLIADDLYRLV